MFKVYDVPGLYIVNQSYLVLYDVGKFTGLVVDLEIVIIIFTQNLMDIQQSMLNGQNQLEKI